MVSRVVTFGAPVMMHDNLESVRNAFKKFSSDKSAFRNRQLNDPDILQVSREYRSGKAGKNC
jgi:hypothetical protein